MCVCRGVGVDKISVIVREKCKKEFERERIQVVMGVGVGYLSIYGSTWKVLRLQLIKNCNSRRLLSSSVNRGCTEQLHPSRCTRTLSHLHKLKRTGGGCLTPVCWCQHCPNLVPVIERALMCPIPTRVGEKKREEKREKRNSRPRQRRQQI